MQHRGKLFCGCTIDFEMNKPPKFNINLTFCPMHYHAPELLQTVMQLERHAEDRLLPKELEDIRKLIELINTTKD